MCTDWILSNQWCIPIESYQMNCVYKLDPIKPIVCTDCILSNQLDPIKWIACTDWILSIQLCVPIRLYQTKCAPIGLSQLNFVCRLDPLQEPNKGPNSNQYSNPRAWISSSRLTTIGQNLEPIHTKIQFLYMHEHKTSELTPTGQNLEPIQPKSKSYATQEGIF